MIRLENVRHGYGNLPVLGDLNVEVSPGEFLVIIGPSGCGKTTLLHLLAGHVEPMEGRVRRTGNGRMMHQNGGLFPWFTVRENIAMGDAEAVPDLVRLMSLQGFEESYPHQLSGGMRQRVELARAMAGDTDLLLMDEPFSALDYQTRVRLRGELLQALRRRPRTVVFVTHDIEDAVYLADRVLVLSPRPASIQDEMILDWEHPRDPGDPRLISAVRELRAQLQLE